MIQDTADHDDDQPPQVTLPAFLPVPRLMDRHNGWKPDVQRRFIEALAETGSVKAACRRVARSDHGAYMLRRHPDATSFRAAWDAALDLGVRRIEDAAMDRALYGTEETIHYHGEHVATRRRYNERLVMFILRNRAPKRFATDGARGMNAVDKQTLKRMRKQWRAEWEAERSAIDERHEREEREGSDDFIETIKDMHRKWYCMMSPATRAAYRAFRELEDAEGTEWMLEPDAEPLSAIEADYEHWFGPGRDRRAQVNKLVDMRAWRDGEGRQADE